MTFADIGLYRHRLVSGLPRPGRVLDRVAAFATRRRRRQDVARLPDHILRDIGVDPDAIRGADHGMNVALLLNNMR